MGEREAADRMTVGELVATLRSYPETTPLVVEVGTDYFHVRRVNGPVPEHLGVALVCGVFCGIDCPTCSPAGIPEGSGEA